MAQPRQRPLSVTLVSYLFIASGSIGIVYHFPELLDIRSHPDIIWIFVLRLTAIVGGIFALRGNNFSRWLLVAWIGYHVFISFYHSAGEVIVHLIVTAIVTLGLFNKASNAFFRKG